MTQLREEIVSRAVACKLLSEEQVSQCKSRLPADAGVDALLAALVKAGSLTKWQVKQLHAGKNVSFFVSHYKLLEPLGAGAMGQVFRAADMNVARRQVAVKILPRQTATPAAVSRFRREGAAALQLQHSHIVRCFELGQHGDTHFLVMELVDGATLKDYIARHGQLAVQETARIGYEVSLALEHAWQQQIVHRDIKPANILLTRDNQVKLADLGLAKFFGPQGDGQSLATQTGMLMGTLDYLAPEQAEDAKRADIRSDLYSLGCTLYHCLTGAPPFASGTEVQKIMAHREQRPQPIGERNKAVENLFADIIEKRLLAKRPEDRYQTPAEATAALEPWLGGASRAFNVLDLLEEVVQQDAASATPLAAPAETQHGWDTYREHQRQGQTGLATRPVTLRARVERAGRAIGLSSLRDTLIAAAAVVVVALILGALWSSQRGEEPNLARSMVGDPRPPTPTPDSSVVVEDPGAFEAPSSPSQSSPRLVAKIEPSPVSVAPSSSTVGSKFRLPDNVEWTVMLCSSAATLIHRAGSGGWKLGGDGLLECVSSEPGWLKSTAQYGDFELDLEFNLPPGANSGVYLRSLGQGGLSATGLEVQLVDDNQRPADDPRQQTRSGGIVGITGPADSAAFRGADQWNSLSIRCQGPRVLVKLNGAVTADVDMTRHAALNIRQRYGHLGISNVTWSRSGRAHQGMANGAKFRNIRLQELSPFQPPAWNPGGVRFFAIWVKNPAQAAWYVRNDLDSQGFAEEDVKLRKAGLRPTCISGYKTDDGQTRFAAVWLPKTDGLNSVRIDLTSQEYDDLRAANRKQGHRLAWIDVYGRGRDRRYAAIWIKDDQKVEWDDANDLDLPTLDAKWKALTAQGYKMLIDCRYVGDAGDDRVAGLWTRSGGNWTNRYGGGYADLHYQMLTASDDLRPVYVNFYRDRPSQDWTATWRPHENVVWQITASADSRAFQADFDRMSQQGYRIDMLNVR